MDIEQGNLEMLKYCIANECPNDEYACAFATSNGQLECLKYLHEEVKAPWSSNTAVAAAYHGQLHTLEYLFERKYDKYHIYECTEAAKQGHLHCLKFLHEVTKAPWGKSTLLGAYSYTRREIVQYLLDNNCLLPPGWRYEGGVLHIQQLSP